MMYIWVKQIFKWEKLQVGTWFCSSGTDKITINGFDWECTLKLKWILPVYVNVKVSTSDAFDNALFLQLCQCLYWVFFVFVCVACKVFIMMTFLVVSAAVFLCPLAICSPCITNNLPPKPALVGHRGAPMVSVNALVVTFLLTFLPFVKMCLHWRGHQNLVFAVCSCHRWIAWGF